MSKTICFRSSPEMYEKELSGVKTNTVRYFSEDEIIEPLELFDRIQIRNTHKDESFTRLITDISIIIVNGVRIFIFSW